MVSDQLTAILNDEAYRANLHTRFWSKVLRRDDPEACWLWGAGLNDSGYGQIMTAFMGRRIPMKASRVAWGLTNGPIPEGLCILHTCDNRPCCNPGHLYAGTKKQNFADAVARGRHVPPPRHQSGASHPTAKINLEVARAIRADFGTHAEKAEKYGLCKSSISKIMRGEAW